MKKLYSISFKNKYFVQDFAYFQIALFPFMNIPVWVSKSWCSEYDKMFTHFLC